jgi:hypothetical protein
VNDYRIIRSWFPASSIAKNKKKTEKKGEKEQGVSTSTTTATATTGNRAVAHDHPC